MTKVISLQVGRVSSKYQAVVGVGVAIDVAFGDALIEEPKKRALANTYHWALEGAHKPW